MSREPALPPPGSRRRPPRRGPLARIATLLLLAALVFSPLPQAWSKGARPPQSHPGLRTIGIWVPEINGRLDVAVWYPTTRAPSLTRLDGWTIRASRNARIAPARYPVILISHDAAASRMANHDLAAELARQGFIVVVPTHPGDNVDDTSALYRAELLLYRPRQIILALEALLAAPDIGRLADESRIGLLGVGSGSATMLQIAGAVPEFSNMRAYCASMPQGDPFCTPWAQVNFPFIEQNAARFAAAGASFTPDINSFAPPSEDLAATVEIPEAQSGPPLVDDTREAENGTEEHETEESRPDPTTLLGARSPSPRGIRGIALLTPGLCPLFTARTLAPVTQPLVIVAAENDTRYPVDRNADMLYRTLPRIPGFFLARGYGFADLQAPCAEEDHAPLEQLCASPDADDAGFRAEGIRFLRQFFQQTLGNPIPVEE